MGSTSPMGRRTFEAGNVLAQTLFIYVWHTACEFCNFSTGVQWQSVRCYRLMGWRSDPNPWRVPKFDKKHSLYEKELTKENESFLEETVLDKYKDKLKEVTSPLKDGPWKRSEWTTEYVVFIVYSEFVDISWFSFMWVVIYLFMCLFMCYFVPSRGAE